MALPDFAVTGNLRDILDTPSGGEIPTPAWANAYVILAHNIKDGVLVWDEKIHNRPPSVKATVDPVTGNIEISDGPIKLLDNNPGLNVTGIQWRCDIKTSTANTIASFWFDAPGDGSTVKLDEVTPVIGHMASGVTRGPQGYSIIDASLDDDEFVFEVSGGQPEIRVTVPALTVAAASAAAAAASAAEADGHASTASDEAAAASGSASAAASSASAASGSAAAASGHADDAEAAAAAAATAVEDGLGSKQSTSEKDQPNGYAGLNSSGTISIGLLPSSIMEYQGVWNAATNTPTLADGTGNTGDVRRVSVGGTRNLGSGSITFDVGDYAIYNGTTWEKSDTTDAVNTVAGLNGNITAANLRTALSLVVGTDVQAYDADLAALAGLTSAANKVPYFTASATAALADLSAFGRTLIALADAAAGRTALGLAIGTNVQAYSAILGALAGLTGAANDDIIQRKAGTFTNRTMAQLKADLALAKADVGLGNVDNTSDTTKNLVLANPQTASYTLVLGDAAKAVEMNVASANNLTVPPNSSVPYPIGTVLEVLQYGAGQTTIVAGAGVTLRSPGGRLKIAAQYGAAALRQRATDEWTVEGNLAT